LSLFTQKLATFCQKLPELNSHSVPKLQTNPAMPYLMFVFMGLDPFHFGGGTRNGFGMVCALQAGKNQGNNFAQRGALTTEEIFLDA
jgi:hypothetical protein